MFINKIRAIVVLDLDSMGGVSMQLQSSYIFLPNPYKKEEKKTKKQDNVIYVKTEDSFVSCLKSAFPSAVRDTNQRSLFKSIYTCNIDTGKISCEVIFQVNSVVKNYYLDVVVSGRSKAQIIKGLEYIQATIEDSSIPKSYVEIISYDAISEYYCNKIYPKLNELERNLRKLLFNIYVVNFGLDYYRMTVNEELQSKVKGVIDVDVKADKSRLKNTYSKKEAKEIARWQRFFYSFEFTDIQKLLFAKSWTNVDEQSKIKFLSDTKNLSELTDEELRIAFSQYTPKSDWERFFSNKISGLDVEKVIEEIRESRNKIAHCKFFYKSDYESCNKAINNLNQAIISAIEITKNKDFSDKNREYIANAMAGAFERIGSFSQKLVDVIKPSLQVIEKIGETVNRFVESYQRYDFSGPIKALENLSTALMLPYNTDTTEETDTHTDISEDDTDTQS